MAQNLQLSTRTGDYVVVEGRPVGDDSLRTPAYIRSKVGRTRWLYAPDDQYGSDYYLYKRRHSQSDDQAIVAATQRALLPFVQAGRAVSTSTVKVNSKRESINLGVTIVEAGGAQKSEFTFFPITN